MKPTKPAVAKAAQKPKRFAFEKPRTTVNDWVDKQVIMQTFHIAERTLQHYRTKKIIPCSKIGGKFFYYLPGLLRLLEKHGNL